MSEEWNSPTGDEHAKPEMDSSVKAQLRIAKAIYRDGRFAEAQTAYQKAHELDPKSPTALVGLGTIALWNNRPEEAEHHFKEAMNCASGLQRLWPFNVQSKALLAMTYYRMDKFAEAAQLFKGAAGPVALGPFADIRALGQQLALFGEETPYLIEGPEKTEIELVTTDPIPVIEVSVNGSKPLLCFIDTGGAEIVLDATLAKEVGAEISGTMTGEAAGPKGRLGLGRVASVKLGEFEVRNVPIHTVDTGPFSTVFDGLDIKGVIGTRLLMHFLATIDYVSGALALRRISPARLQELEGCLDTQRIKAIPFWLIQTHYIVAWGTVNSKGPWLFFVDTGLAGKGFTGPGSTLREAGISVDWAEAQEGIGGFGKARGVDIVLRQLTLGTPPNEVVGHDVPGTALEGTLAILGDRLGFWIGGLISHQFFRNYALTFDFTGMRLFLEEKAMGSGQPTSACTRRTPPAAT